MAQPQWITPAGSLSTIQEGVFYQVPLQARDPDGGVVYYRLIAGRLPEGIQVRLNGTVEGIPRPVAITQGVPAEVSENITSKFAVRAFTERVINGVRVVDRIADRTFELTVTGNDVPEFVTPPGRIGTFYDGTEVELQIEFTDPDPDDDVIVKLAAGELPPGVALTRSGLVAGFIEPLVGPPGTAQAGWSITPNDEYPWDFVTRSASRNYEFTVEITDGKDSNLRTFSIYVYSRDSMSADTTDFDASNTFITADASPTRTPVLITPEGDLGRIRADNWFAYKFDAIDFDGDQVEFAITVGEGVGFDAEGTTFDEDDIGFDRGNFFLPPGLTIDINSGWFYGYIPDQGATEQTYRFAVRVKKASNPDIISPYYYFTITIIGNIETEVIWITPEDLGTINNGATSTLTIEAYNTGGRALEYRLAPGSDSRLPQGLTLLPSGNIVGRVSFNTFALDGGTTTFDQERSTRLEVEPTTFDMTCEFTVNAYAPISQDLGYQVATFFVTSGGSGYYQVPVTVSAPPAAPDAVQATAYATVVTPGVITEITIDNPGFGYVTAPTITIGVPPPGGIQATATATISGSRVTAIVVNNGGSGYEVPTVTVGTPSQAFGSVQATAGAVTVVDGRVTVISVGNPGRGYITAPTVTIISDQGSGATAVSTIAAVATVNAVSVLKRFRIVINRAFNTPYERLYIKAMPPLSDRNLVNQLLLNQDIIPADRVYRRDDPNFGVAQNVVYDHAYGLAPATLDDYARSLDINHYWKNLVLGEIRTAQALDAAGNIMYEVVYSTVLGGLTNRQGASVSKSIRWPYPIELDDSSEITTVYPASLPNMRDQVIDSVGQISPALPAWMTSKQADGRVLGFTQAWVICYTKPGESARIAYNIREIFGDQLNKVDFKADRYELDRSQTHNWDPDTDSWIPSPPAATTFDDTTTIFDGGSVRFIAPADQYTSTDRFDKYLLYPRINILG